MYSERRRRRSLFSNYCASGSAHPASTSKTRADILESICAKGFQYSRNLVGHTACVNALAFTNGQGQFLASGGDDLKIRVWDFYQDDVRKPIETFDGPSSNIFTLNFSATNRYLLAGGIDNYIFKYDVSSLGTSLAQVSETIHPPDTTISWHDDTIRSVTCHPTYDELFMSGSEDGRILRHDGREGNTASRTQHTLHLESEVTGVAYHPNMEHIFLSSQQKGLVCLHDERMAFGPLSTRSRRGVVRTYNTTLTKPAHTNLCNPEPSSIAFDREGSRFVVSMLHWYPTMYSVSDDNPIAILTGKNRPDGTPVLERERTYSNGCTMKHGSFGGPGLEADDFFATGSDDFRGYVWKLPITSDLVCQRREITADDWDNERPGATAYTTSPKETKYVPVELSTPLCRLTGHNSIVNNAVFHPHFLHIVTSGVERHIVLHSPTRCSPCAQDLSRSPVQVRQLNSDGAEDRISYYRALMGLHTTVGESDPDSDASERSTISMFDHILREEGKADVFAIRSITADMSMSSEEEYNDDSDSDVDMSLYVGDEIGL